MFGARKHFISNHCQCQQWKGMRKIIHECREEPGGLESFSNYLLLDQHSSVQIAICWKVLLRKSVLLQCELKRGQLLQNDSALGQVQPPLNEPISFLTEQECYVQLLDLVTKIDERNWNLPSTYDFQNVLLSATFVLSYYIFLHYLFTLQILGLLWDGSTVKWSNSPCLRQKEKKKKI